MTATDASPLPDEHDVIRLTVPALPPYGRVARLAMTGLASRNAFPYDEVEDVRIAVGEVFGIVVEPATPDARLLLTCVLQPGRLDITIERAGGPAEPDIGPLSRQILDAVVDRTEVLPEGAIRITKFVDGAR